MNAGGIIFLIVIVLAIVAILVYTNRKKEVVAIAPLAGPTAARKVYDTSKCYVKQPDPRMMLRIVRGTDAGTSYPFIGAIKYRDILLCGATLIDPMWCLGAAHCIAYLSEMTITLGKNDLDAPDGGEIRNIVEFYAHPRFNTASYNADIALFKLDAPVITIKPICLPLEFPPLDKYLVAGWGATENGPSSSRMLASEVFTTDGCKGINIVCAVNNIILSGPCLGDSGGPLFHLDTTNRYVIDGVVSRGAAKCVSTPTTFTKVAPYVDWILATI